MRRLFPLLVLLVATVSVCLATTVQQLQEKIKNSRLPDAELAKQLGAEHLSERLSRSEFTSLLAELPGPLSRQALLALADQAAFQAPPKNEIPALAAPTPDEQARILAMVGQYIRMTLPTLPNFMATRSIVRYQDRLTTEGYNSDNNLIGPPLQVAQTSTSNVVYSAGQETSSPPTSVAGPDRRTGGLSTKGAFGTILATIQTDSAQAHMKWARWEHGPEGSVAVFRFAVPQKQSHYEVTYCCVAKGGQHINSNGVFSERTGYHGEIAVDSSTGVVRRLVLIAELGPTAPVTLANLLVEYGPVEIGGKAYNCPLKSVTISRARVKLETESWNMRTYVSNLEITMLTDTVFSSYHRFRGDLHVLSDGGKAN